MTNKKKLFISFSGGVESTTMCILYGKGATAIWCDTGAEHYEMYNRLDLVYERIKALHNGDFNLVKVKAQTKARGIEVNSMEDYAIIYQYMPSQQARYCTSQFKIMPIDNFLESQGDCELMIGFNADEEGRTGNLGLKTNVTYSYPLIDDGLTREDCENILNVHNLHPKFPAYMSRGGCRMCFFKSEKEYKALYFLNQKEFFEVEEFERKIQGTNKKFYSIMGNRKSLKQLAIECENERLFMKDLDWNELYTTTKKETSCGAFCHR